jgi:hypothetical protein
LVCSFPAALNKPKGEEKMARKKVTKKKTTTKKRVTGTKRKKK